MNLYKISQCVNTGYDTFDAAVVAAPDEAAARNMNPAHGGPMNWTALDNYPSWARNPVDVRVELIGVAAEGTHQSLIVASIQNPG